MVQELNESAAAIPKSKKESKDLTVSNHWGDIW